MSPSRLVQDLPPPPQNIAPQQGEPEMIGELMDERLFRRHVREHWTTQDWQLHRWAYARFWPPATLFLQGPPKIR